MTGHPAATSDVLVIGAGPAGIAAARAVAGAGHRVVVVDSDHPERTRRGAALLIPRAVAAARELGLDGPLAAGRSVDHVRISARDDSTSTTWPGPDGTPAHGIVVDRRQFDDDLTRSAGEDGVEFWFEHEALAPVVERGFVRGAHLTTRAGERFEARASFVVVADGANSRFGRALGSHREPSFPYAVAHHAEYRSAIHDATEIEIVVGLTDRADTPITGYGWMFPTGRGTVDVGVLLFSTSPQFQVLNPVHVHDRLVGDCGERWHLDGPPTAGGGGRIPLGRSVGPAAGPTWLLVGDAVGAADPWSGAGLGAALVSGAAAGDVLVEALASDSAAALQRYPAALDERFEPAYGVGRLADRLLGRPAISGRLSVAAARSRTVADGFLRLATGALRPGHPGPAELTFRIARGLGVVLPGV